MRIVHEYSHFGGTEVLRLRYPEYEQEIYEIIAHVQPRRSKVSRGQTMPGRSLSDWRDVNGQFRNAFRSRGYGKLCDTYTITMPNSDAEIRGVYEQIDYMKSKVLVEVQFGTYAAMFHDMATFEYFSSENRADVGVEIVPCFNLHKEMPAGVSYGEKLVYELERLKGHFPAVPVKLMLVDA